MAEKLPSVDALFIGFGWTAAIVGQELASTGMSILALERGDWRDTPTDFATTFDQDELRYYYRHDLFMNVKHDTLTVRNSLDQTALPMRHLGSFLPGTGVGGSGVHWNAQIWRFLPDDFKVYSHNLARYGKDYVTRDNMTIQDWPVSYDDLEPYYDKFDKLCGTSGKAGNLRGQIVPGGNPFEGPRSDEYPNPPLKSTLPMMMFDKAAKDVGYHPFVHPAGNSSRPYTNPLGAQLGECTYCGFCEKFVCGNSSKATAQTTILPILMTKSNFTLKTGAEVMKINLDSTGKRAVSVTYVDLSGREFEQPAEMIFLSAYILNNVQLMLLSGIGKPYDPDQRRRAGGAQLRLPVHLFRRPVLRRQADQPVHRGGRAGTGDRRLQRRQLRSLGQELRRRRRHLDADHQRPPHPDAPHARRHAQVGR